LKRLSGSSSGEAPGALRELSGSFLGALWELFESSLGALRELSGKSSPGEALGDHPRA